MVHPTASAASRLAAPIHSVLPDCQGQPADLLPGTGEWKWGDATPLVLVLAATGEAGSSLRSRDCLASAYVPSRVYWVERVTVPGFAELARYCIARSPRLLLVDAELISKAGADALGDLRRRLPAMDWLLIWDAPTPDGFEGAVRTQARGSIDRASTREHLAHALDAVLAGELWFTQPVLRALYLRLLTGTGVSNGGLNADAAVALKKLTAREVEVLALMRRGMTNKVIAKRLCISVNTVKKHLAHVFEKRGLSGRRQQLD